MQIGMRGTNETFDEVEVEARTRDYVDIIDYLGGEGIDH